MTKDDTKRRTSAKRTTAEKHSARSSAKSNHDESRANKHHGKSHSDQNFRRTSSSGRNHSSNAAHSNETHHSTLHSGKNHYSTSSVDKNHRGSSRTNKNRSDASSSSAQSICPVSHLCGACQMIDMDYQRQLDLKQQAMVDLFEDIAAEDTALHPILGMSDPFHYRNKVASPYAPGRRIKKQEKGRGKHNPAQYEILCGMYAKGTHRIIDTSCCLLENQVAQRVIRSIRQLMPRFGLTPYDEDTGEGFIRHAIVRVGHASGEVLVTLCTNGREFPSAKAFCRELSRRVPEVTTVVQNVNTKDTNAILGHEGEHTLYGPGFILDDLCGLRFRISSHSFYQVNATQTEALYRRALELAGLTGTEVVMDAYCGTGTIGLVAAQDAARIIGVDEVESAIRDARNNARHNGIENAEFFAEDAGAFMHHMADQGEQLDVLLMDPPRAGSTPEFLKAAVTLGPERIVYISCGPTTQERDAAYLVEHGYRISDIQPVDMFPHTEHVENILLLVRDERQEALSAQEREPHAVEENQAHHG